MLLQLDLRDPRLLESVARMGLGPLQLNLLASLFRVCKRQWGKRVAPLRVV